MGNHGKAEVVMRWETVPRLSKTNGKEQARKALFEQTGRAGEMVETVL